MLDRVRKFFTMFVHIFFALREYDPSLVEAHLQRFKQVEVLLSLAVTVLCLALTVLCAVLTVLCLALIVLCVALTVLSLAVTVLCLALTVLCMPCSLRKYGPSLVETHLQRFKQVEVRRGDTRLSCVCVNDCLVFVNDCLVCVDDCLEYVNDCLMSGLDCLVSGLDCLVCVIFAASTTRRSSRLTSSASNKSRCEKGTQ